MPDDASFAHYQNMGPSLLTKQPLTAPDRLPGMGDNWGIIYEHLTTQVASMRMWRYSWWAHWARIAEFFLPRRYQWVITANKMNRGSQLNEQIIDSTGPLALNVCASGMWTGLTSPSRPWFKLTQAYTWQELSEDGREWLEDAEERLYTILAHSNFYPIMAQAFQDVAAFGTAPVIIYEDYEDVIRCYLPCAGEYFLKSGARNSVDTMVREYTQTVLQLVEMFGSKNVPAEVRKHYAAGGASLLMEFTVLHCIEPNYPIAKRGVEDSAKVNVVPPKFVYREVYWLKGVPGSQPMSVRGFYSRPFMAARWSQTSNDPYGRSPCMDALGDNKQVQMETRRKGEFIEKLVRPPMGANPELKNEPSSIIPGMITYMNTDGGKKGFWPLFEMQAAALQPLVGDIKEVSARIDKALFVDVFMAISRMEGVQPRNELELTKRDLERLQILGPFVHLFETEFAGPAIKRIFDIAKRRNLLKPMPDSLKGVPLKIEYSSIMKLAQRSAESVSMKDFFGTLGELSSAAKAAGVPDPIRVVDLDKSIRHYGDITNFPSECLFTEEEVKQHDQVRHEETQKAQLPGQAMAGVKAAQTLSQTQLPDGNSALGALLGGGGGGGG